MLFIARCAFSLPLSCCCTIHFFFSPHSNQRVCTFLPASELCTHMLLISSLFYQLTASDISNILLSCVFSHLLTLRHNSLPLSLPPSVGPHPFIKDFHISALGWFQRTLDTKFWFILISEDTNVLVMSALEEVVSGRD